eukprot:963185-Pleurochrysis_carterae.AAC.1
MAEANLLPPLHRASPFPCTLRRLRQLSPIPSPRSVRAEPCCLIPVRLRLACARSQWVEFQN